MARVCTYGLLEWQANHLLNLLNHVYNVQSDARKKNHICSNQSAKAQHIVCQYFYTVVKLDLKHNSCPLLNTLIMLLCVCTYNGSYTKQI